MKTKNIVLDTFSFADIDGHKMPEGLVEKLRNLSLYTYKDVEGTLKEHIYSTTTISDYLDPNGDNGSDMFTYEQMKMLEHIIRTVNKKDIGYFRFVFM